MTDIHRDLIALPGAPPLAYLQAGHGRDVVLLHGALTTAEEMVLALGPALTERFRITAFDRPGHGLSGRAGPTGTAWRQAEAVHAAVEALGLDRPVVVGHSFGGALALAYGLQYPGRIAGVVALAPIAFPELRLEHLLFAPRGVPFAGEWLNGLVAPGLDPVLLPILWRAMFAPQPMPRKFLDAFPFERAGRPCAVQATGEDAVWLNAGLARALVNYPACRTPVRILGGGEDKVVNNRLHGQVVAGLLPNAAFESLPGLGHMLHHFAQPKVVAAVDALVA